jgi:hypothetical protein
LSNYETPDENSYRIGRVTIDSNLHTQSADEAYFHYFGNDVLYSHKEGESDILHFDDTTIDKLHLEKGKYNGLKIVTEHGDSIELANYLKTA